MKLVTIASLLLLLCAFDGLAQTDGALRIASVGPYPNIAPGQILELRVEGLGEQLIAPPPGDELRILLTQHGATKTARARTAVPVMIRETPPGAASPGELKAFQGMTFVVPRGLHAGEAEVVVSFRGRKSAPFKLNVVERPQRAVVGGTAIASITPGAMPATPQPADAAARQRIGLKFERGAKGVAVQVRPLADPEDPEAGVLVRFKQGGAFYDAAARVVHHAGGREQMRGGFGLTSPRDVLELDVPEMLAPGEAELEITLRAGGQTGEAALVPVTITDAERAFESPKAAAPRLLSVSPRRVGAGQALSLSVDRRLALDPDPSKAVVVFESPDGVSSYKAEPEVNSAVIVPSMPPDAPVFILVRAREQGAAQPPDARRPRVYDPASRYVSIRVRGLDMNPRYVRVRFEQEGRAAATLVRDDFVLYTGESVVVRLPKGFEAGAVRVSVENLGASGYSAPSVATFQLSGRR